ncbi:MAG: hypothetical protein ACOC3E_02740 [Cyanobacteriota bacterium]
MKSAWYRPILASILANSGQSPPYLAAFDSSSAMLRSTAAYLRGEDFPRLGVAPSVIDPFMALVNQLPPSLQEFVYTTGSANEGIPVDRLKDVRSEVVSQWVVNEYPQRDYPAVAIGSSCGALVHLYAALGIPWLPQTYLIPVNHPGFDPNDVQPFLEWGIEYGPKLLEANPNLQLHHMHDPNEDHLTSQGMTYFRVKQLRLGAAYERFLENCLPKGGTILIVECRQSWRTTQIGDRHFFQMGAVGGATEDEFLHGSDRVTQFLKHYNSPRSKWDAPTPNTTTPEAEWGFEATLRDDIERFARQRGYKVRRIVYDKPADPSPFVAQLYRDWYQQRSINANRLLVESFVLHEPYWTLKTGSIPYWMTFNMQPDLSELQDYLNSTNPYDEIYMMLFSHGTDSVGLASIEEWRTALKRAKFRGEFVGVDENAYPRDFASMVGYHNDLKEKVSDHYPLPDSLSLEQLDQFIENKGDRFSITAGRAGLLTNG